MMKDRRLHRHMHFTVKTLHSLVWMFFVTIVCYVFYAGWTDSVDRITWLAAGLVMLEGLVLLSNEGVCPLTEIARRYESEDRHRAPVVLPEWLLRYHQAFFGLIFGVGLALVVYRTLT